MNRNLKEIDMKKIRIAYLLLPLYIAIFFSSCDEVSQPYTKTQTIDTTDTSKNVQKVLIEDFTGFRCLNCPKAAAEAKRLMGLYPGKVFAIGIHSGFFATPTSSHPYDFRTTVGTALDNFFGVSKVGNPNGLVNRIEKKILGIGAWDEAVSSTLLKKPKMTIKLTPGFNSTTNEISLEADIKYLEGGTANHYLSAFIIEDSVVQYQLDGSKDVPNYVHMHVLRASLNGTWGDQLSTTDIASGAEFKKQLPVFAIPTDNLPGGNYPWNPKNLKIIAFVHDYNASYEILQVEEAELIK
jgi:hypothetical protein